MLTDFELFPTYFSDEEVAKQVAASQAPPAEIDPAAAERAAAATAKRVAAAAAYLADRRRLIGPVADITHGEFGRENRPDETFAISSVLSFKLEGAQNPSYNTKGLQRIIPEEVVKDHEGTAVETIQY